MANQAYLFLMFVINGILIGVLFDIFRILRKSFKTSDFVTYIEDIIFWILTGILTLYFIFYYNNGEIRFYIFLGIIIGALIYMLTISKHIIKFSVTIITFFKDITIKISKIILYPLQLILTISKKLFLRPISFICINLRKSLAKFKPSLLNFVKKTNKTTKKAL